MMMIPFICSCRNNKLGLGFRVSVANVVECSKQCEQVPEPMLVLYFPTVHAVQGPPSSPVNPEMQGDGEGARRGQCIIPDLLCPPPEKCSDKGGLGQGFKAGLRAYQ